MFFKYRSALYYVRVHYPSSSLNNFRYKCATVKKLFCCEALQTPETFKKEVLCWVQALRSYESLKLFPYICMGNPFKCYPLKLIARLISG